MPDDRKDYNVKVSDDSYLNAFRAFEPYLNFGESIPGPNFNLSPSNSSWQKYDETGANLIPFGKLITTNDYKVEGQPIKGYAYGSVVKGGDSHIVLEGDYDATIMIENNKLVVKSGSSTKTLTTTPPDGVCRLGILLVGAGGNAGSKSRAEVHKKEKNGDYYICGGGGGGANVLWGIVSLDKFSKSTDYYYIKVGKKKHGWGNQGNNTYLLFNTTSISSSQITSNDATSGIVAYAGGGYGGAKGSNSSTVAGGDGGSGWSTPSATFFDCIGNAKGVRGATYNYNDLSQDMDGTRITTDSISYSITFAKDPSGNLTKTKTSDGRAGCGNDSDWGAGIRLPGGASWEAAGVTASWGGAGKGAGGGASCAHTWDISSFEKGGDGYWVLFY